jgi:lincosamide nucleotidyltransferase A/C/D/E
MGALGRYTPSGRHVEEAVTTPCEDLPDGAAEGSCWQPTANVAVAAARPWRSLAGGLRAQSPSPVTSIRLPCSWHGLLGGPYPLVMRYDQVTAVLDGFDEAGIRYWVAGGWGIALLTGRQSRAHRDLDLFVGADLLDDCLHLLDRLGYSIETDWLPTRIELAGPDRSWVDLHPLQLDADGSGWLVLLDGANLSFPQGAFATGTLRRRAIPCLSADHQRTVHAGYDLRPEDVHDLGELDSLAADDLER